MPNIYDQFDVGKDTSAPAAGGNPYDQFDTESPPEKPFVRPLPSYLPVINDVFKAVQQEKEGEQAAIEASAGKGLHNELMSAIGREVESAKMSPEEVKAFASTPASNITAPIGSALIRLFPRAASVLERSTANIAGGLENPENLLFAPLGAPEAQFLVKPVSAAMIAQGAMGEAEAAKHIIEGKTAQGAEEAISSAPNIILGGLGWRAKPTTIETKGTYDPLGNIDNPYFGPEASTDIGAKGEGALTQEEYIQELRKDGWTEQQIQQQLKGMDYATQEREQPSGAGAELPRVPPRTNLPAHPEEIREEAGQRPTGSGGTQPSPEVKGPQQNVQPGISPEIQSVANESGFEFDNVIGQKNKFLSFTFRNLPKDDPAYGQTFTAPEGASAAEVKAAADAKMSDARKGTEAAPLTAESITTRPHGTTTVDDILSIPDSELSKLTKARDPQTGDPSFSYQREGISHGTTLSAGDLPEIESLAKSEIAKHVKAVEAGDQTDANAAQQRAQFMASVAEGIRGQHNLPGVRATYDALVKRGLIEKPSAETPGAEEPVVESVTPLDPQSGMPLESHGAARRGEAAVTVKGSPDVYGIRQSTRQSRAEAGQVEPVQPGKGINTPDSLENGRAILERNPDAAERALTNFENDPAKNFGAETIAVTRAHGENLALVARRMEEEFGTDSDEFRRAYKNLSDWDARTKPIQTEWSKAGKAQQGETDIDTGSLTGLRRAYKQETGEELPEGKQQKAKEIAKKTKKANDEEATSKAKVNKAISDEVDKAEKPELSDAEKKAIAAAHRTVRLNTARLAELENKTRVARTVREREIAKVQEDNARKALAAATERARQETIRRVKEENKARVARADINKYIWVKARDYINAGIDNFDDLRNKLATDLGMKVDDVTRALAASKKVKALSDDMWKKQQLARKLRESSKRWLMQQAIPTYVRALQQVPRVMFGLKVGFHGTVALGTHAPMVAFQPPFWKMYVINFGKMYHMVGSSKYYEIQIQDLMRRDNYITARRAGLVNDPFQFEDFNSPDTAKYFGNLTGMGNRGYSVLKMLRQDMFDQHWNRLPASQKIPAVAKAIADGVNHATGVVQARAPLGSNLLLFAPRLEASRVAWLAVDPIRAADTFARWSAATPEQKAFAVMQLKEKAWVAGTLFGLLALNEGVLSAIHSKQQINFTDPTRSDFLKFKAAGMDFAYGNAMMSMARLPVRLYSIRESDGGKLRNLVYPDESSYSVLGEYGRSQLSPFASLASTLWFKSDWQNRPLPNSIRAVPKRLRAQGLQAYTWPEFWSEQVLPIPAEEAAREVWKTGMGMSDEQVASMRKALATIAIMAATGGRLTDDVRAPNPQQQSSNVPQ